MQYKFVWRVFYFVFLFLMFLSFSIGVTNLHQKNIDLPNKDARVILQNQIIQGKAESPYRYRILFPYLTEWLVDSPIHIDVIDINKKIDPFFGASALSKREYKMVQTWYVLEVFFIFMIFTSTYLFLNRFPMIYRILGCFFLAIALNAAYIGHAYQPWSTVEASLFPFAFYVMSKIKSPKSYIWLLAYLVILILACFNRETGIFIAAFFVITVFLRKELRTFKIFALIFCIVAVTILGGIRLWKGSAPSTLTIQQIYTMNLAGSNTNLMQYELKNMFSVFWIVIVLGLLSYKREWWNYLLLIVIYMPFYFIFGLWAETRLLLPILSILIFAALYFFEKLQEKLSPDTISD